MVRLIMRTELGPGQILAYNQVSMITARIAARRRRSRVPAPTRAGSGDLPLANVSQPVGRDVRHCLHRLPIRERLDHALDDVVAVVGRQ